jgi:hypothetical protein
MVKNKTARAVLLAIFTSLLSYSIVQACSLIEPTIIVRCSNLEVSIGAEKLPTENDIDNDVQEKLVNATFENLQALVPKCAEDLTPVLSPLRQELVEWFNSPNQRRVILDGNLIFEPYSTDRAFELQKNKNNLLSCGYSKYKQIGNWLIILETSRPYCQPFWYALGSCPSIVLSLGAFFVYLVTNFSLTTLPYLAGFFLAGVTTMYIWWKVLRDRPALKLWKMIVLSFIILTGQLCVMALPVWLPGQIIGWISCLGLLVLWYIQVKTKRYVSKSNAG